MSNAVCMHGDTNCVRCGLQGLEVPTIHLHMIVDISPSMISRWPQTLSGLNEYLSSLRQDQAENNQPYKVTVTTFGSSMETPYEEVVLDSIPTLTDKNFKCNGNGTALYDAVGIKVKSINTSEPVLVVVMTDGEDNSSHKWDEHSLDVLLEERKKLGNYTFAYLGVDKDAWGGAAKVQAFHSSNRNITHAQYMAGATFGNTDGGLAGQTVRYSAHMRSNFSKGLTRSMSVSNLYDPNSWASDANDLPSDPTVTSAIGQK